MTHPFSAARPAAPSRAPTLLRLLGLALCLGGAAQANPSPADIRPSIVGGSDAAEGQYPFMVSLQLADGWQFPDGRSWCGGSLIAADAVLTAAHCVQRLQPEQLTVLTGQTRLSDTHGVRHAIASIHVHPGYEARRVGDVAVLKLVTPVKDVTPVALAGREGASFEQNGRLLWVAGWGRLGVGDARPDHLQHVEVPFIPIAQCQQQYAGRANVHSTLEMCASRGGHDACHGDSGGPLLLRSHEQRPS